MREKRKQSRRQQQQHSRQQYRRDRHNNLYQAPRSRQEEENMFSFLGYYRDEDGWALGDTWGCGANADATAPASPPPSGSFPNRRNPAEHLPRQPPLSPQTHREQPSSPRPQYYRSNSGSQPPQYYRSGSSSHIHTAAEINSLPRENGHRNHQHSQTNFGRGRVVGEYSPPSRKLSMGTSGTRSSGSSGAESRSSNRSEESARGSSKFSGCPRFKSCTGKIILVSSILVVLFLVGLGVGLGVQKKQEALARNSVASANTGATNTNPEDGSQPQDNIFAGAEPTAFPTVFFDFDYDNWVIENSEVFREEDDPEWAAGSSKFLVGAYYYPWHGNNFHNRDGYIRKDLEPRQAPALGEYDDSKPEVIAQHLRWSRQANIGLWITSWWGPNRVEDTNTKDVIMAHPDLGDMKIALHYETSGRLRGGVAAVRDDIKHMCEFYFDHPNYYKINGRSVIFVYVTRKLEREGNLEETILTMRTSATKCGHDVYLIGDHVFADAPEAGEMFTPFWYFDAVTNYDVYGSMGRPSPYAGMGMVDNYYNQQRDWRTSAILNECRYVPAVSPGYNDRGVRLEADHPPLSRKLTDSSEEGSLFAYQISKAKALVDPMVDNLLVVNSFNEWHEDTQIEPALGGRTNLPLNLTKGVYYEGYGDLYLEVLRKSTME